MIDKKWIGYEPAASVLSIECGRLQMFAKVIGETDPVYFETAAAQAAGYPDVPAPPTFLFAVELESGASDRLLDELQIPISRLLHGEQSFTYHAAVCVGDTITVRSVIGDIYDKKDGQLEFVVKNSRATNQREELVAELRTVLVCRS